MLGAAASDGGRTKPESRSDASAPPPLVASLASLVLAPLAPPVPLVPPLPFAPPVPSEPAAPEEVALLAPAVPDVTLLDPAEPDVPLFPAVPD
jgi:hypothetical protein